jgi:uncharacterized protein YcbX
MAPELMLTGINRFPVTSLRGQAVASAVVEPWGLRGDRRWMVVDSEAVLVTAREHPHMLLARPQITGRGLRITRPGADPIEIDTPDGRHMCDVAVWKSVVSAAVATSEATAWFTDLLGQPVRLVYLDDPTRRRPNPLYARPDDRVSFADGYPLLMTSEASLAALNQHIADGPRSIEGPLPMIRFRPNLVIGGSAAWAEDGWRRVRIGEAVFRAVKGCDRCVLTTIDPDTAVKGKEPIATLARHRRWDGKTWFGMSLIPDTPGASVTVGDEVEILDAVDAPDGPPR